jgi:hypothetical protein
MRSHMCAMAASRCPCGCPAAAAAADEDALSEGSPTKRRKFNYMSTEHLVSALVVVRWPVTRIV